MTNYDEENGNNESIKFETKVIKSSLCDWSSPYIFVTGDTTVTGGDVNANDTLKNFALFTKCITYINDEHIYIANNFDITVLCTIWLNIIIQFYFSFSDTFGYNYSDIYLIL